MSIDKKKSSKAEPGFWLAVVLMAFVFTAPLVYIAIRDHLDRNNVRTILVDGKRCKLFDVKVGEHRVHGMTHDEFETRATCRVPDTTVQAAPADAVEVE